MAVRDLQRVARVIERLRAHLVRKSPDRLIDVEWSGHGAPERDGRAAVALAAALQDADAILARLGDLARGPQHRQRCRLDVVRDHEMTAVHQRDRLDDRQTQPGAAVTS